MRAHGVTATVRRNRGVDIAAACGQLRTRVAIPTEVARIGNNGNVNQWKWVNHFQPQTLVIATFLCYIDAVFGFIFPIATSVLAGLLMAIALGAGGFGIANEKRWGYAVAVAGAVFQVIMLLAVFGSSVLTSTAIINLMFDGALVALLLHPMSREYQRIWFK